MSNVYYELATGGKVPRKLKKAILGKRLGSATINKKLKMVVLGEPIKTMFEIRDMGVTPFCPNCGCEHYCGSGNLTHYPEHWEKFRCLRCRKIVGYIDNSPFIHALECADNNYNPVF